MEPNLDPLIFPDGEFQACMARKALSYISSRSTRAYTSSGLYYSFSKADNPKGAVTILHGFSDGIYKYRETIFYLLNMGYDCLIYEHRGHGRSVRQLDDPSCIHIDDFDSYVEDLNDICKEVLSIRSAGLPWYLYGHSMGGCIAALFCEKHCSVFEKLILACPMTAIRLSLPLKILGPAAASFMCHTGKAEKTVSFNQKEPSFKTSNATSRERWEYYRTIRESNILLKQDGPTWSWVAAAFRAMRQLADNAEKIQIPSLVLLAEKETMVDNSSIMRFASKLADAHLVTLEGTKHEICLSCRDSLLKYYTALDDFLCGQESSSFSD